MTEPSQDAADFTILAFAQSDLDFGAALANFSDLGSVDACKAFRQIDASLKPSHGIHFNLSRNNYKVIFGNTVLWVGQTLR